LAVFVFLVTIPPIVQLAKKGRNMENMHIIFGSVQFKTIAKFVDFLKIYVKTVKKRKKR